MIVVFDLDDTLYDELTYVRSGFSAVARHLGSSFGLDPAGLLSDMDAVLASDGRGAVFDAVVAASGIDRVGIVDECVAVYRSHVPDIELYPEARGVLARFADTPTYVVTDGNPLAQQTKVLALGVDRLVSGVFLTSAYGSTYEKPSIRCFEMIAGLERVSIGDVCYVADNPVKDFVGLNEVGARTIRVLTGQHAEVAAAPGFDAAVTISGLGELASAIMGLSRE